MTAQHRSTQLAAQVCQTLETAPDSTLPMTYQQLAEMLALEPPRTVQRVASALEVSAICHLPPATWRLIGSASRPFKTGSTSIEVA